MINNRHTPPQAEYPATNPVQERALALLTFTTR